MGKKLTASVVGGGTGGKLSINALRNSEFFELVAVTDMRQDVCQSLEKEFSGVKAFTNYKEMFKACPTDVVCVSTWAPSHESVTMDALELLPLKGILVEKPLGHTAKSGCNILNAIKAKKLPMAVPHGLLVKKVPVEIINRVGNKEIGELRLVEIQCNKWDIINAGIHWLNFFVSLTNNEPIDYVMAICETSTRTFRDGMQVETTGVTYAQTKSGIRVVMNTGDDVKISREGKDTLFRLVGTGGIIEFWGWENSYYILNSEFPKGKMFTPDEFSISGHQRHLENMVDMINSGNINYKVAQSSLIALELCEGAYMSSKHCCKVAFPVDDFKVPVRSDWELGMSYSGKGGGRDGRKL